MGCANSKTGATGTCGAPEEEAGGAAPPKVMVDGEGQEGAVAANGSAVSCANGAEDAGCEEKEGCNGDVAAKEDESAPSGGEKSDQNGGCEEEGDKSIQDGGAEAGENNEAEEAKEEEKSAEESENAESRENNEEEKPE